jgi:tRNA threonylcarbamoyladenosine biosynthesis protein TsaE
MGTGKTTFLKVLLPLLGIEASVSSPTFSLVNQYDSLTVGPIFHMDLYRVVSIEELEQIGIYDYLESGNYVFIEWPDLLLPYFNHFAMPYVMVSINVQDTESRLMEINGYNLFGQND